MRRSGKRGTNRYLIYSEKKSRVRQHVGSFLLDKHHFNFPLCVVFSGYRSGQSCSGSVSNACAIARSMRLDRCLPKPTSDIDVPDTPRSRAICARDVPRMRNSAFSLWWVSNACLASISAMISCHFNYQHLKPKVNNLSMASVTCCNINKLAHTLGSIFPSVW